MKKVINMLSKADSVDGQGVGSAYLEQVALVKDYAGDVFEVRINSHKKADIIHVHSVNPSFYLRFKKKNGVRVMYCHFLPETLEGSIKLPKLFFNIFCKYVMSFYKKADYLVVVNPIFTEKLIKLGVKEDHIKYIPNFVSEKEFYQLDAATINKAKDFYNIPKDKFIVLGCGQIQTRKGVKDFIEVANNNPDLFFVWAGGFSFGQITDGYSELKKIVENPPKNVLFTGMIKREKMNEIYNMVDALFVPSYNELFPMTILEAASVGKPMVLRDLELYKPILWDKPLYAKDNETFGNLLTRLKEDKNFYNETLNKINYIKEYYSRQSIGKMWKDFYLSILK